MFDSTYRAFGCHYSLRQCDIISRWCWRLTGMLTEFFRPGSPSIGNPGSILHQSLLHDVVPDWGQVVTSTVSVQ